MLFLRAMLVVFGAIVVVLTTVGPAHAYVDPGSGSVIVTTILGLIAAIGYTFRKYFYKLRGIFSSRSSGTASAKNDRFDGDY